MYLTAKGVKGSTHNHAPVPIFLCTTSIYALPVIAVTNRKPYPRVCRLGLVADGQYSRER